MRYTFDELMRKAEEEAGGGDVPTRATIVKELLHYDILLALSRSDLARRLAFQGGTALRLCYGAQRYSEDLDFTCGAEATESFDLGNMEKLLQDHVVRRYGLTMEVQEPRPGRAREFSGGQVAVRRWLFLIRVPGFAAAQRIHFEVCNVPSYEAAPRLIQPRYGFLSDVYADIALRVESLNEILADKAVALIARNHLKARDVWDLRWLVEKGVSLDVSLVRRKLDDYRAEAVPEKIEQACARLRADDAPTKFVAEMSRFVTPSLGAHLRDDASSAAAWLGHALTMLDRLRTELVGLGPSGPWIAPRRTP
jgi:predicted nucleotidyltransferase component of viral defense system